LTNPRRVSRPGGIAVSFVLHAVVIGLILWPATRFLEPNDPGNPFLAPGGGGGSGGGGGKRVAYISLPAFTPPPPVVEEVVVPPVETPEVPPPVPEPVPVRDSVADSQVVAANLGPTSGTGTGLSGEGGTGGGVGPGNGTGTGPGTGPGSGGSLGYSQPPQSEQLLLVPPDAPRELRGKTVRAMFSINVNGRVDRVAFDPEIKNREYANKLREQLLAFRFKPARSPSGTAIAVDYPIDITFGSN
jgi:protein TonB